MSRLSNHHRELNEDGIGKCSVPMFDGCGSDAGFCDREAYGKYIHGPTYRDAWTGEICRLDGTYAVAASGLACPGHGGPQSRTFLDGDMYCAVLPGFVNIQESLCGFGKTREAAMNALADEIGRHHNRERALP